MIPEGRGEGAASGLVMRAGGGVKGQCVSILRAVLTSQYTCWLWVGDN